MLAYDQFYNKVPVIPYYTAHAMDATADQKANDKARNECLAKNPPDPYCCWNCDSVLDGYEQCCSKKNCLGCPCRDPKTGNIHDTKVDYWSDCSRYGKSSDSSGKPDTSTDADCNSYGAAKPLCVAGKSLLKGGGNIGGLLNNLSKSPTMLIAGVIVLVIVIMIARR